MGDGIQNTTGTVHAKRADYIENLNNQIKNGATTKAEAKKALFQFDKSNGIDYQPSNMNISNNMGATFSTQQKTNSPAEMQNEVNRSTRLMKMFMMIQSKKQRVLAAKDNVAIDKKIKDVKVSSDPKTDANIKAAVIEQSIAENGPRTEVGIEALQTLQTLKQEEMAETGENAAPPTPPTVE